MRLLAFRKRLKIVFKKRRKKFDKHIHIYNDKVGYGFLEAIRTIRTRVMREMNRVGGQVIMITSSVPVGYMMS